MNTQNDKTHDLRKHGESLRALAWHLIDKIPALEYYVNAKAESPSSRRKYIRRVRRDHVPNQIIRLIISGGCRGAQTHYVAHVLRIMEKAGVATKLTNVSGYVINTEMLICVCEQGFIDPVSRVIGAHPKDRI